MALYWWLALLSHITSALPLALSACTLTNPAPVQGASPALDDSVALKEMEQMHTDLALVTFRVRNLMDLLEGSGATVTDVDFLNTLEETNTLVNMMTAFAE